MSSDSNEHFTSADEDENDAENQGSGISHEQIGDEGDNTSQHSQGQVDDENDDNAEVAETKKKTICQQTEESQVHNCRRPGNLQGNTMTMSKYGQAT